MPPVIPYFVLAMNGQGIVTHNSDLELAAAAAKEYAETNRTECCVLQPIQHVQPSPAVVTELVAPAGGFTDMEHVLGRVLTEMQPTPLKVTVTVDL